MIEIINSAAVLAVVLIAEWRFRSIEKNHRNLRALVMADAEAHSKMVTAQSEVIGLVRDIIDNQKNFATKRRKLTVVPFSGEKP